jgi:HD-like signal output (HDOD) protein
VSLLAPSDKLHRLFRRYTRPESDAADVAARLEEKVLALAENMPPLPDAAKRALAEGADGNLPEFARLIEGDAAVATAVLRLANSAPYAGDRPAARLEQAVSRLGMRHCLHVVVATGMRSVLRGPAGVTRLQGEVLWQHASVTASLCRRLNRGFRLGFDGEEYSAGLLHDLGRILLALADADCFARAGSASFVEGEDLLDRERGALGIDHCVLGAWFAEHNKLPESIVQAIRLHHEPWLAERSRGLVTLVAAADHAANHLQLGEDIDSYDAYDNLGLQCLWEAWSEERRDRLLAWLPGMMEEAARETADEPSGD